MMDKEERCMADGWGAGRVKCPFWKGETDRAIFCQGLIEGEKMKRLFPTERAKQTQKVTYCCKHYQECKVFQIVH